MKRLLMAAALVLAQPVPALADAYYDCETQLAVPWMGRDEAMWRHFDQYCADLDRERFERRAFERNHWEWRR